MRDRLALRAGSKSSKLFFFFFFAFYSSLLLGVFARNSFFGSVTPNPDKSQRGLAVESQPDASAPSTRKQAGTNPLLEAPKGGLKRAILKLASRFTGLLS
jgi:hypothetical protein